MTDSQRDEPRTTARRRGIDPAVKAEEERCISDLLNPWRSRNLTDRNVTGAILTAFYRGVQVGQEMERAKATT